MKKSLYLYAGCVLWMLAMVLLIASIGFGCVSIGHRDVLGVVICLVVFIFLVPVVVLAAARCANRSINEGQIRC